MSKPREVYALIHNKKSHYPDLYNESLEYLKSIQRKGDSLVTFIEKSAYDKLEQTIIDDAKEYLELKAKADKLAKALDSVKLNLVSNSAYKYVLKVLAEYRGEE